MFNKRRPFVAPNWDFRKPTKREMEQMIAHFSKELGFKKTEMERQLMTSMDYGQIAILDTYTPTSPAWGGKIGIVFWGGGYSMVDMVRFTEDGLEEIVPEQFEKQ